MSGIALYNQHRADGIDHMEALCDAIHLLLKATWKSWESDHVTKRKPLIREAIWYLDDLQALKS